MLFWRKKPTDLTIREGVVSESELSMTKRFYIKMKMTIQVN